MAAEYSFIPVQTVAVDENVTFNNGCRACHKGFVQHRDDSGIFFLKGSNNGCKAIYRVTFVGNVAAAAADGGVLEPLSVALTINGESLGNATAIVTPAAIETDFFNVSVTTFIDIPFGCCVTVSVENTSATSAISVQNANIIFDRVA
jgi:hypothetical protein